MDGWSRVHDSCYRLLRGSMTHSTAKAHCIVNGGRLALISSDEELAAVQAYIKSEGLRPPNITWVDGSDAEKEGVWRTSAGDVMTYLGWTGVELNGGTNGNCMALYGKDVWDSGCDRADITYSALCEPVIHFICCFCNSFYHLGHLVSSLILYSWNESQHHTEQNNN